MMNQLAYFDQWSHHKKTSQLIFMANQLGGFYMTLKFVLYGLKIKRLFDSATVSLKKTNCKQLQTLARFE